MIYLDHAATSFPKPRSVISEVGRCMRLYGGNPGRGSHRLALAASERVFYCREELSSFFDANGADRVCFTLNATAALNLAIKGILRDGDHVLISDLEHNAVWRPIAKLAAEGRITYDLFPSFATDPKRSASRICMTIARLKKPNTRMLVCTHLSNVCSCVMPIAEIGELCQRYGIFFVVDGAQSAGHLPISVEKMHVDALCIPSHKGLWGPQGCGAVIWGSEVGRVETLTEGGSGYRSLDPEMPKDTPERFEAGTLPTPAIAGLSAGIEELGRIGIDNVSAHIDQLHIRALDILSKSPKIRIIAPHLIGSVMLLCAEGVSPDQLGNALDRRGICTRSGYHCAPLAHQTLQTPEGGALRVSFGYFNSNEDVDALCAALRDILK